MGDNPINYLEANEMKVTTYCINNGTESQYFGLKNAEENTVLHYTPTWKTEKGAIRWAIKNGFEVVCWLVNSAVESFQQRNLYLPLEGD